MSKRGGGTKTYAETKEYLDSVPKKGSSSTIDNINLEITPTIDYSKDADETVHFDKPDEDDKIEEQSTKDFTPEKKERPFSLYRFIVNSHQTIIISLIGTIVAVFVIWFFFGSKDDIIMLKATTANIEKSIDKLFDITDDNQKETQRKFDEINNKLHSNEIKIIKNTMEINHRNSKQ